MGRDNRLRYHYKDRYDVRANMIDWDYQMELREDAPVIHFFHYKHWRQTGVAFEQRFSSHIIPNRTMGSYVPGRTVLALFHCLFDRGVLEKRQRQLFGERILGRYYYLSLSYLWN